MVSKGLRVEESSQELIKIMMIIMMAIMMIMVMMKLVHFLRWLVGPCVCGLCKHLVTKAPAKTIRRSVTMFTQPLPCSLGDSVSAPAQPDGALKTH